MCDDIQMTVKELKAKGVEFTKEITDGGTRLMATLRISGGDELGLYEPRHPSPLAADR